ncbi:helix-turn-helix domain-containing protein [Paenibacillus macerans]|uniref:Cro/C1-type HTH DNA-binding domain protein n=1 Tax=Paenibacillus macerans TaxID=44252 RepID=A0A091A6X0_PAEMA|nr:DNA-binding protein [Paenibacillus macerans]KFN11991.1 cro/C1-type HTH DNA-binding domain protein [Paenibacillus macerans]MCY7559305.1 transcriptional regulator [Paenibacillus macerans]MEC0150507.1 transcriptional regulator [Paenibacillus macerans]SUD25117.1 helix-turn-helix domain-containing protein [Paenibacillus macerans]
MNNTTTILGALEQFSKQHGLNISQLSRLTELNTGTMSAILNSQRVLSVHQLDRITKVMNLPDGHFYEQYIQEYLNEVAPNWRRIKPFFYRCAELDKLDCIKQIVNLLLDNPLYASPLFEVAEELIAQGKRMAAAILYESVALSEKSQHSERLAYCQYKLFLTRLGPDQEQNYRAAIQFEPFAERLEEIDQLVALKDLADTYRSLRRWDKVKKICIKLKQLAEIQYSFSHSRKKLDQGFVKLPRPLFFYVVFGNMLISNAYYEQGDYELALQILSEAADLEWVKETDEETLYWKNLFQEWTQANILLTKLMAGDIELLSEYVNYFETKENEILTGLWNIMIVANRYKINLDHILTKFESVLSNVLEHEENEIYNQQNTDDQLVGLLCELADYYLIKGDHKQGFKFLIDGLKKSTMINDESSMLRCMRLFERFRNVASAESKVEYHQLVEMGDGHEKKYSVVRN